MTPQQGLATPTPSSVNTAPSAAADQAEAASPSPRSTRRRITRFTVELSCLLCARDMGVLQSPVWPTCAGRLLRPGLRAVDVPDWHHLRCGTCGGSVIPVEVIRQVVRMEPSIDWSAERPRRGRPPKRLAAERGDGSPAA